MSIGFLQDIDPYLDIGGAQKTDLQHIRFGERFRGYEIEIITPQNISEKIDKKYELIIVSNCCSFEDKILKKITEKNPYVVFVHDFYFCNYRLHYPMRESCRKCPKVKFWNDFFKNSKKNIFLSPLHRQAHKVVFNEEILGKISYVPSNIDVDFWKPIENIERKKNTAISINGLAVFKGRYPLNTYIEQHQEMQFTIVGQGAPLQHKNITYVGAVNQEKLRDLFSAHEYMIHIPENVDPFCRSVIEALLCGCKIIKNDNVGAFSYQWNFNDREAIRNLMGQSGAGFWDEIYEVIDDIRKNKNI